MRTPRKAGGIAADEIPPASHRSIRNMASGDWEISRSAIVVLILLGCIISVLIGYSMHRLMGGSAFEGQEEALEGPGNEQMAYMRQIRQRNLAMIYHGSRTKDSPV
ncbi:hypothetical protein P168DRAFT_315699 [Aspergillus campestris IBT 28561]|uniref:Uncharacterized protein n=1 Tax=Aspergillus campestris (strain IBT 28561) TaxID=1392248 RepID=A0A2I1DBF5_ASPC2|nr:uncharacterized protein P168DRAFT_315699 [Aspergillus campestris IBT 28561]PKY07180.1 hypothetical protein P168DRAFT_315699 [Aspergillus campestris IBT 28561]